MKHFKETFKLLIYPEQIDEKKVAFIFLMLQNRYVTHKNFQFFVSRALTLCKINLASERVKTTSDVQKIKSDLCNAIILLYSYVTMVLLILFLL